MEVRFEPGHHLGSAETSHETYSIDRLDIVYGVRTYYSVSYIHIILSSYNHLISVKYIKLRLAPTPHPSDGCHSYATFKLRGAASAVAATVQNMPRPVITRSPIVPSVSHFWSPP